MLITSVALVGVGQALLVGTYFQLVAFFPTTCTPFLFMGNGLSSLLMLGVTAALGLLKDASHPTSDQLKIYWFFIVGTLIFCLIMFHILIRSKIFFQLIQTRESEEREPLLMVNDEMEMEKVNPTGPKDLTWKELILGTKIPCISIFLNFYTSLLLISFYSFVPSTGVFTSLVQILNYATLLGDFFGRQLVLLRRQRFLIIKNSNGVLVSVLVRCVGTILFFLYVLGMLNFTNDYVALAFIGVYALAGGYSNTLIYIYGSSGVPPSQASRASSMINLALQGGVAAAIISQFALSPFLR